MRTIGRILLAAAAASPSAAWGQQPPARAEGGRLIVGYVSWRGAEPLSVDVRCLPAEQEGWTRVEVRRQRAFFLIRTDYGDVACPASFERIDLRLPPCDGPPEATTALKPGMKARLAARADGYCVRSVSGGG